MVLWFCAFVCTFSFLINLYFIFYFLVSLFRYAGGGALLYGGVYLNILHFLFWGRPPPVWSVIGGGTLRCSLCFVWYGPLVCVVVHIFQVSRTPAPHWIGGWWRYVAWQLVFSGTAALRSRSPVIFTWRSFLPAAITPKPSTGCVVHIDRFRSPVCGQQMTTQGRSCSSDMLVIPTDDNRTYLLFLFFFAPLLSSERMRSWVVPLPFTRLVSKSESDAGLQSEGTREQERARSFSLVDFLVGPFRVPWCEMT